MVMPPDSIYATLHHAPQSHSGTSHSCTTSLTVNVRQQHVYWSDSEHSMSGSTFSRTGSTRLSWI